MVIFASAFSVTQKEESPDNAHDDRYLSKHNSNNGDSARNSKSENHMQNISYEFTTDGAALKQYYDIREIAYRESLGIPNFSGQEDKFDRLSHLLVVRCGPNVIGGARLTVSSPDKPEEIPLEEDGMNVKSQFPQLNFAEITYCEMSRLALLPEFRNNVIAVEIHNKFIELCIKENIHIGFARTTALQQRRTKTIFNSLGYEMIIRRDIELSHNEKIEHLHMQFSCVDFTPNRRYSELLRFKSGVISII